MHIHERPWSSMLHMCIYVIPNSFEVISWMFMKQKDVEGDLEKYGSIFKAGSLFWIHFVTKRMICICGIKDMFPSGTRRHVSVWNKKTWLLVQQADVSTCGTRGRVCFCTKRTSLLVEREDMPSWSYVSSCSRSRHVCVCNKKTGLRVEQADICLLVQQEDVSSSWGRNACSW